MAKTKRPSRTGHIYKRGRLWWIKYHRDGFPYAESSKSEDHKDAERLLAKRLGDIATGKFAGLSPERIKVNELLGLVIDDYEENDRAVLKVSRYVINAHLKDTLGPIRAAEFGQRHVKQYIARRRHEGAADATINRELSLVRRGFTLAFEADPPLVTRQIHIPKLKEDNARQGFIEHDQYVKLRDALPDRLKAMFVIAFHVGLRKGELRSIQLSQVDRQANEIRLMGRQTKNGEPRTVPIYGEMGHWLDFQKARRDQMCPECPWVFFYRGKQIGDHLRGWDEACEAVGLPDLLFHDLRRSAVRNMERAGIPRKIAMGISGHKTESVYRRYDIVSSRDIKLAALKLEQYLEKQSKPSSDSDGYSVSGETKPEGGKLPN